MEREIQLIEIEKVITNPFQPRKDFDNDGIKELSESIKNHGVIQPVIVRRINDGFQLISGERRMRACKEAGLSEVPAIIMNIDGVDVAEVSLIENMQRKDLNCIEEGIAFAILKKKFGMTQDEIAEKIGKSRPYVTNTIRLLELPEEARNLLFEGKLSAGHGRALLSLPNVDLIKEVIVRILRDSMSVRQAEKMVQGILSGEKISKPRKQKPVKNFKDARLYFNAVKKALKDIKSAGGKADIIERETEDYLEIVVRIPRGDAMADSLVSKEVDSVD